MSQTSSDGAQDKSSVPAPTKVYVGELPQEWRDEQLRLVLAPMGAIARATVVIDHATGNSRGFGFVTFARSQDYEAAIKIGYVSVPGTDRVVTIKQAVERKERKREQSSAAAPTSRGHTSQPAHNIDWSKVW